MNFIARRFKPNLSTTITSSTTETTISPAAVEGTYLDLYRLTINNSSATGTLVTIRSSNSGQTGDRTTQVYWVAPGAVVGFSGPSDDALPQQVQTSQANASTNVWTATCTTSVASIVVNAEYVRNTA